MFQMSFGIAHTKTKTKDRAGTGAGGMQTKSRSQIVKISQGSKAEWAEYERTWAGM